MTDPDSITNSKLAIVDAESRCQVEDLAQVNDELNHLFNSIPVGMIVLDRELRIRRFNSSAQKMMHLTNGDLGQSMQMVGERSVCGDLLAEYHVVLETLQSTKREVQGQDGCWYLLEIRPHDVVRQSAGGLVLTISNVTHYKQAEMINPQSAERLQANSDHTMTIMTDIDARKKVEDALFKYNKLFEAVIQQAPFAVHVVEGSFNQIRVLIENEESRRIMGEPVEGRTYIDASKPEMLQCRFFTLDGQREIPLAEMPSPRALKGEVVRNEEFIFRHSNGTEILVEASAVPVYDNDGNIMAAVVSFYDITAIKLSEEKLRVAVREKETLLRELYHRTKNNMQVISAMLDLQAAHIEDKRVLTAFTELKNRIRAMALVHQKLYESQNLSSIDLGMYISDLLSLLIGSYQMLLNRISFILNVDSVMVLIDTAIPCGLILNELISNALKHAFPEGREGEIVIRLAKTENNVIVFSVSDNGVGVPEGFDFRHNNAFGLQTVFALAEHQLHGTVSFAVRHGVTCQVQFEDNLCQPRI
ncbi:MAG: PAS domain-containing protein [Anaerolineae bacterium]|nr:PAS domain-containing protein [Anaerolineae bacterium]